MSIQNLLKLLKSVRETDFKMKRYPHFIPFRNLIYIDVCPCFVLQSIIIPGNPHFLHLSYIKQSITYGCTIIAGSRCFTFSLKSNRKDDMASGLLYAALQITALSFLHVGSFKESTGFKNYSIYQISLFQRSDFFKEGEVSTSEQHGKNNLSGICLLYLPSWVESNPERAVWLSLFPRKLFRQGWKSSW